MSTTRRPSADPHLELTALVDALVGAVDDGREAAVRYRLCEAIDHHYLDLRRRTSGAPPRVADLTLEQLRGALVAVTSGDEPAVVAGYLRQHVTSCPETLAVNETELRYGVDESPA